MSVATDLREYLLAAYMADRGSLRPLLGCAGIDIRDYEEGPIAVAPGRWADSIVRGLDERGLLGGDSSLWPALEKDRPMRARQVQAMRDGRPVRWGW